MNKKQDFFTYYEGLDNLQKSALRAMIVERLRVTEMSFYNWYKRRAVPRWHTASLASLLEVDERELFPEHEVQLPPFNETTAAPAANSY